MVVGEQGLEGPLQAQALGQLAWGVLLQVPQLLC